MNDVCMIPKHLPVTIACESMGHVYCDGEVRNPLGGMPWAKTCHCLCHTIRPWLRSVVWTDKPFEKEWAR